MLRSPLLLPFLCLDASPQVCVCRVCSTGREVLRYHHPDSCGSLLLLSLPQLLPSFVGDETLVKLGLAAVSYLGVCFSFYPVEAQY